MTRFKFLLGLAIFALLFSTAFAGELYNHGIKNNKEEWKKGGAGGATMLEIDGTTTNGTFSLKNNAVFNHNGTDTTGFIVVQVDVNNGETSGAFSDVNIEATDLIFVSPAESINSATKYFGTTSAGSAKVTVDQDPATTVTFNCWIVDTD